MSTGGLRAPGPWSGGELAAGVHCLLAPNPSPMTLDGTNTWLIVGPQTLVIDPGPAHEGHLRSVVETVQRLGSRVGQIWLTHAHLDHSEGAARLAELTGSGVRALDPAQRLGDEGLGEGDVLDLGGAELRVLATPGHTSDSLTFLLVTQDTRALLTGDTVLGRGTTVVAHPDGKLGPYLDSLTRLHDLVEHGEAERILPGHGPALDDAAQVLGYYRAHRHERLEQVRQAVEAGARGVDDVVATVYADVPRSVWPAAAMSVQAQLEYLQSEHPRLGC
ncbi:MAG: MBL fold metallo-hydrolase [Actinomycetales bacterium]